MRDARPSTGTAQARYFASLRARATYSSTARSINWLVEGVMPICSFIRSAILSSAARVAGEMRADTVIFFSASGFGLGGMTGRIYVASVTVAPFTLSTSLTSYTSTSTIVNQTGACPATIPTGRKRTGGILGGVQWS
jgi:hypothetical protein